MSLVLPISHRPRVMKSASFTFSTCEFFDIFAARPDDAQGETGPLAASGRGVSEAGGRGARLKGGDKRRRCKEVDELELPQLR